MPTPTTETEPVIVSIAPSWQPVEERACDTVEAIGAIQREDRRVAHVEPWWFAPFELATRCGVGFITPRSFCGLTFSRA